MTTGKRRLASREAVLSFTLVLVGQIPYLALLAAIHGLPFGSKRSPWWLSLALVSAGLWASLSWHVLRVDVHPDSWWPRTWHACACLLLPGSPLVFVLAQLANRLHGRPAAQQRRGRARSAGADVRIHHFSRPTDDAPTEPQHD